jgi:hypothetical protein
MVHAIGLLVPLLGVLAIPVVAADDPQRPSNAPWDVIDETSRTVWGHIHDVAPYPYCAPILINDTWPFVHFIPGCILPPPYP